MSKNGADPSDPRQRLLNAGWRAAPSSVRLLDVLESRGGRARFVGGCVRDTLAGLEREAWDVDLCTSEPPDRVLQLLEAASIRAIPTGLKHGTVTAVLDGQPFEITTLRRDTATDGRHAVVAFTDDFREDAARRDFTINAMSVDRDGRLFDYFDGAADLTNGIIRFVGEPTRRIEEDYLRVLRFFRFYARFGRRAPDGSTAHALRDTSAGLDRLSGERVWQETRKLLEAPDPLAALHLMTDLGTLAWLMDAAPQLDLFEALVRIDRAPEPMTRLAALARESGANAERLAERLRLSNAEAALLARLVAVSPIDPLRIDAAELRRSLFVHGAEATLAAGLFGATDTGTSPEAASAWRRRVEATPVPLLPVAGRDVVAHGVAPGPAVGKVLATVETWWVEDGCSADRETTLKRLQDVADGS